MTPRQADIAFVLEGLPGVLDVHVIEGVERVVRDLRFAVKLAHGGGHLAAAHFALLRVLSHEECRTVLFFEVDLPPALRACARRVELSVTEREAAHGRVPATSPALLEAAALRRRAVQERGPFAWMIVGSDAEVHRALAGAFGSAAPVLEPSPVAALERARRELFDLILCDARVALGRNGFLAELYRADVASARRVVVLGHAGERDLLIASLDELRCWNSFLCRPVELDMLREIVETGCVVQRWSIPVLPARNVAPAPAPGPAAVIRRVLVVDDDPTTEMLLASTGSALEVTITSDEWEAVDRVTSGELDLVVCSVAMRTRGGTAFYRFLWNARPDIKRRFVFIARRDPAAASTGDGRAPPVIERPVTREILAQLVEGFAAR